MASSRTSLATGSASIVVGVATGVLTNLVTDGGGLPYVFGLVASTAAWVGLYLTTAGSVNGTTIVQRASRDSSIRRTKVRASGPTEVRQSATGRSVIEDADISAHETAAAADTSRDDGLTA